MPEYREIAGFPGYWVGDDGSVWSTLPRRPGAPSEWHPIAPHLHGESGHLRVNLYPRDSSRRLVHKWVHVLVLEAFVGPRPPGMVARHFPDRDPHNNHRENLQWGTLIENMQDKRVHGTAMFGDKNPRAKLNLDKAREVRRMVNQGMSQQRVADLCGIGQSHVSRIVLNKVWPEDG